MKWRRIVTACLAVATVKLDEIHQHLTAMPATSDTHAPGPPTHNAQPAGDRQTE